MTKTCTKCGCEMPATSEFFHAAHDVKSGLRGMCKGCDRRRHKAYNASHPDKVSGWKADFRARHRDAINAESALWYAENAERERLKHAAYRAAHIDAARGRDRTYYLAHREEFAAYTTRYRAEHPERTRELCRRRAREHPEWSRNRKARKRQAVGTHTAADIATQYLRQNGRCYWCGEKVGQSYHVDHVFPLAKGGSNGPENLVIACPTCNCAKGAKMPHEFSDRLC